VIMLAFNIRTVAIGAAVCVGLGAIGVKYVDWKIDKLKHRNFMINQGHSDLKKLHCNVRRMKSPKWPSMLNK
jgi:hypothetical protein